MDGQNDLGGCHAFERGVPGFRALRSKAWRPSLNMLSGKTRKHGTQGVLTLLRRCAQAP
jgi:hypothetical protein